jgi:hypothetical protein
MEASNFNRQEAVMEVRAKLKLTVNLKLTVVCCGLSLILIGMPERNVFAGGYSLDDIRAGLDSSISRANSALGGVSTGVSQAVSPYITIGKGYQQGVTQAISSMTRGVPSRNAAQGWVRDQVGAQTTKIRKGLSESKSLQRLKGKAAEFINNNSSLNVSANKFYQKQVMSPWLSPLANMLNTAKNYKDKAGAMWNKFSQRVSGVYARTNPPTPSSNLLLFSVGGVLSSARTNPGASQNNNTQSVVEGKSNDKRTLAQKQSDAVNGKNGSYIAYIGPTVYMAARKEGDNNTGTQGSIPECTTYCGGRNLGKSISAGEKFLIDMQIAYRITSLQVANSPAYQAAKASLAEAGNTISGAVTTVTTTTNSASNTVSNLYGIQKHYENIGRKTVDKGIRQAYNDVVNYIKPNPDNQNNAPTKNVRKLPVFRERTVAKQRAYEPNRMWNSKEGKWDYSMILVETSKGVNAATGKKETWRSFYQPGKKNPYFVEKVSPRTSSVVSQQRVTASKAGNLIQGKALNNTNLTGAPVQLSNLTAPGNVSTPLTQTNLSVVSEKIKYNPAPEGKFNVSDSLQLIADSKAVVDTKNNTVTSMRVDPKTHRMYWVKENRGQGNATSGERIEGPVYKETARTAVLSDSAGWATYREGTGTSAETRNPDGTPFSNTGSRVTYEDFINQITNKLQDTTKVKLDSGEEFSVQSVVFSKPIMSTTGISEYAERLSGVVTTDGRFIPNSLISTGVTSSGASYNYVVPRTLSPGAKGKK